MFQLRTRQDRLTVSNPEDSLVTPDSEPVASASFQLAHTAAPNSNLPSISPIPLSTSSTAATNTELPHTTHSRISTSSRTPQVLGGSTSQDPTHDERGDDPEEDTQEVVVTDPTTGMSSKLMLRAQFGRRYTHNEQTFVLPCGVIINRGTMYSSEARTNVKVCVIGYIGVNPCLTWLTGPCKSNLSHSRVTATIYWL